MTTRVHIADLQKGQIEWRTKMHELTEEAKHITRNVSLHSR